MTAKTYLLLIILFVSALVQGCGSDAHATTGDLSLISGRYTYTSRGYDTSGKPFYEVGQIVADGQGHWHLNGVMNVSGQIVQANSDWVYTLDGGLSGTAYSVPPGDNSYIFISADGKTINMIQADPSSPWMAIFTKDP